MKENNLERVEQLLKKSLRPSIAGSGPELRRDLWPAMLKRLEARPPALPWFDWALLVAVAAWLAFYPGAIPVLLYHL
jgi:hypothetical protein